MSHQKPPHKNNKTGKSAHKRNLKSTLIEPFKQIKLGLYVLGISLAFVFAAGFLFVAAFTEQYKHVMNIFDVVDPNLRWELVTNDIFYTNAIRLGACFAAFIVILFSVVFRMTHKVYGPLVSIERFINQMSSGNYGKRLVIRQADELQRLANRLNHMAAELERRHGKPAQENVVPEDENDDLPADETKSENNKPRRSSHDIAS